MDIFTAFRTPQSLCFYHIGTPLSSRMATPQAVVALRRPRWNMTRLFEAIIVILFASGPT